MTINTTPQSGPRPALRSPRLGPLQHAPRRIRPPFDMAGYAPADGPRRVETTGQWRARTHADRVTALLEPLDGIELGGYDRRIIEWLAGSNNSTIGAIASLLYRARAIDPTHGAL